MTEDHPHLLSAMEAISRLGVSRQTLYSYVSRRLIRAVDAPGDSRRSLYDAGDVARLVERRLRGRARRDIATSTTDWGEPILRSSLTRIADGTFSYRGRDALALAKTATLEDVAALLWTLPMPVLDSVEPDADGATSTPLDRCFRVLAREAGQSDWTLHPPQVSVHAARLLRRVVQAVAGVGMQAEGPAHAQIATAWQLDATAADLIRQTLVLCADHELNASAYAARVVASTGASLAACVLTGVAALSGPRHGGMTDRVRALMANDEIARDPARALSGLLARGEQLPGFGHRLYPAGDPRAAALLAAYPPPPAWATMIAAAAALTGLHPTIDVALATIEHVIPLPQGGGLGLFIAGRTVGWIAHALEQRAQGGLIRPRADYVET